MAKPTKKKSFASKSKIRNKSQSKKNSSKNKKRSQKKPRHQGVSIERQDFQQNGIQDEDASHQNGRHDVDNDVDIDDLDVLGPDASVDDIDYLLNNRGSLSFLSQALESEEPSGKRKKKNHDELETAYEKKPRQLGNSYEEDSSKNRIHLLPVKGKDGLIKRSIAKEEDTEEHDEDDADKAIENAEVEQNFRKELTVVELYAEREKAIKESKMSIAVASEEVLENPETNLKNLKKLLDYCAEDQLVVVRKLALVSLCEIFKDIVPGYRIRPLTEAERAGRVSKDVKKLRDFEESLVQYYKKYLDVLEETVQGFVNKKARTTTEISPKIVKGLGLTAISCMVDVLASLNHFNYRTNLIVAVVSKVNFGGERAEVGDICVEALRNLFINDEVGDLSLEAMKVIARMAKSSLGKLRPQVLETLLHLNIDAQLIKAAENRESKIERLRKRKEQLKKMSRKERKRKKLETKLDKELQETQAVESKEKIQRNQTEILKFTFVIYFRVLKQERKTPLLTPVLKGLAKYAYLINVDFFSDLMVALNRLINSGELSMTESMSCVLTAFKILSGQGEVLNIDPQNFYLHLYNSLVDVAADSKQEDIDLCIECLNLMLVKRRKQVSIRRIQGFVKRIATISLQNEAGHLVSFLLLLRSILQLNQKCDALLDNERLGRGVFQPELPDPEHCNADSTALWESSFLRKHYSADVNQYSKHIAHGAPSQGQNSLPAKLTQRKETKDDTEPALEYFFPENIPPERKAKKRRIRDDQWSQSTLKDYACSVDCDLETPHAFDFAKFLKVV